MSDEEVRALLLQEIERLGKVARYRAGAHYFDARYWTLYHRVLGIPLAIVSAVAGASALSSFAYHNIIAGVLSLIVAILTPVSTFFKPADRGIAHQEHGSLYQNLCDEATKLYIDAFLLNMSNHDLRERLGKLMSKLEELDHTSPIIINRRFKMLPSNEDLKRPLS